MPGHYDTIKAQLTSDLADTLGGSARVFYGRMVKPKASGAPVACVFTGVERAGVGRQVQETYGFQIALMTPLPSATDSDTDVEGTLMALVSTLTNKLAPFDTADVPVSSGRYAGVGSLRRVTSIRPMDREPSDQHAGIVLDFSCMATVFQ